LKKHLDHIAFPIRVKAQDYRGRGFGNSKIPVRVPKNHGINLQNDYHAAIDDAKEELTATLSNVSKVKNGYYLEFEAASSFELRLESLDVRGMELLSIREENNKFIARSMFLLQM